MYKSHCLHVSIQDLTPFPPFAYGELVIGVLDVYIFDVESRSNFLGGYENLRAVDFAKEMYFNGDTAFHGPDFGGTAFRVIGAPEGFVGPYVGGDLNYIKQGFMYAARGMSPFEIRYTMSIWNQTPWGTYSHTDIRNHLANYGYELWMSQA